MSIACLARWGRFQNLILLMAERVVYVLGIVIVIVIVGTIDVIID